MLQYIDKYLPFVEFLSYLSVIAGAVFIAIQIWQQRKNSRWEHDRQRKQSTIEFYNTISSQSQAFIDTLENMNRNGKVINYKLVNANRKTWESVTWYLSRLERLAVGVATDIFDFDILNRIAGKYLSRIYSQLNEYIKEARIFENSPERYKEFEFMVNRIIKTP